MRILLQISSTNNPVPYNYHSKLVGSFHKWMGANEEHDEVSLYSLSWLMGGKGGREGLSFKNGATWIISCFKKDIIKKIVNGIQIDPNINFGMKVKEVILQKDPVFSTKEEFHLLSPVFIKRNIDRKSKYFFYNDKEASVLMTETLQTKLKKAGLDSQNVSVAFDDNYLNPKTKMIDYNGIKCKANICPVIINGTPEQIAFAWNVGVGNSTGIGFGALK